MLKDKIKSYDYTIIAAVGLLSLFGLVMVYSSSMVVAVERHNLESNYFFVRQSIFLIIGFFVTLFFALFPYRLYARNKILISLVLLSILALIGVLLFGEVRGNARSWFDFGPLSLQPSEFIKVSAIIYLSAVYGKKQKYINKFNTGVIPPLVFIFIVCVLTMMQPDYGTAGLIALISSFIIFSSGMNVKNLLKLGGIGFVLLTFAFFLFKDDILSEKRLERFQVLSNPFHEDVIESSGYQLSNAFIAIGGGGIEGLGLGNSIQKLGYLPEPHTDFIMAIIAEELGIFGVSFVLLCLGYIVIKGLIISIRCKDAFGSLLAIGISSMIGIQTFINLGGITGLIPLTGVPLPFISYGGSSFLQLSIAIGILLNVSMHVNYEYKYKKEKTLKKNSNHHHINV